VRRWLRRKIDLLRTGGNVAVVPEWIVRGRTAYDYLVCINRAGPVRDRCQYYAWLLRARLPVIGIPLASGDPDAPLDLHVVLNHTYASGAYGDRLNYDQPCRPPLSAADQAWARELIDRAHQTE
jgi:hypothetical protein